MAADIKILREKKAIFTLSADEWTWQRRRFLGELAWNFIYFLRGFSTCRDQRSQNSNSLTLASGVTLHCSEIIPCLKHISIELLSRFRERATAENLEKILTDALGEVGLRINDISGLKTDAAAVMKKLGRTLKKSAAPRPFYNQLCLAHGLDLAVRDAFEEDNGAAQAEEVELEENAESENWKISGIFNYDNAEQSELEREFPSALSSVVFRKLRVSFSPYTPFLYFSLYSDPKYVMLNFS